MRSLFFLMLTLFSAGTAVAETVTSSKMSDVSVTIYRDPRRSSGMMNANWPGGYALITETRMITLPQGESQVRFENVAEGLLPETAIITGLPKGVREKNRDARLISPAGLVDAYLKRSVRIRRTDKATGKVREQDAIIQTGPNGGVLLKTSEGLEALHCSGLPERMTFGGVPEDLTARPTLSVLTRSDTAMTVKIQLTYMAQGFDWSANYVANMAPDQSSLGLFAWLTVANGGQQSFPNAQLMVVGGKPNKGRNNPPPPPSKPSLDLQCWPFDGTSTHPVKEWSRMPMPPAPNLAVYNRLGRNEPGSWQPKRKKLWRQKGGSSVVTVSAIRRHDRMQVSPIKVSVMSSDAMMPPPPPAPPPPAPMMEAMVQVAAGASAQQEELGDLKLYRVPMRVTVAAQSQKQVAMLNQPKVSFRQVYEGRVAGYGNLIALPMTMRLRAQNVKEQGLGLALPAGSLALFEPGDSRMMLVGEHPVEDLAVGQDVELQLGESPDVQWTLTRMSEASRIQLWQATVSNARNIPIHAEIIVPNDITDRQPGLVRGKGGWILPLDVPANGEAKLNFSIKL